MVFVNSFDFIFNVCRSWLDVLHILVYLLLVIVASLVAFYKFDKDLYMKHVYNPFFTFFSKANFTSLISLWIAMFWGFFELFIRPIIWTAVSNRLPYVTKMVKHIAQTIKNKFN